MAVSVVAVDSVAVAASMTTAAAAAAGSGVAAALVVAVEGTGCPPLLVTYNSLLVNLSSAHLPSPCAVMSWFSPMLLVSTNRKVLRQAQRGAAGRLDVPGMRCQLLCKQDGVLQVR